MIVKKGLCVRFCFFWLLVVCCPLSGEIDFSSAVLKHRELDTFSHSGFLSAFESDVTDILRVNGSLQASRCQIYELEVHGEAHLHECVLHGPVFVKGSFEADHSVFQGPIALSCQSASFTRCAIVQDIEIKRKPNFDGKQVLRLKRGAVVQGNVRFESKNGEVLLSKDSRINGGVIGGKIRLFID